MIQIQNFNASLRHVTREIYFFIHMTVKPISDPADFGLTEKPCGCEVVAGQSLRWKGRLAPCLDSLSL